MKKSEVDDTIDNLMNDEKRRHKTYKIVTKEKVTPSLRKPNKRNSNNQCIFLDLKSSPSTCGNGTGSGAKTHVCTGES